MIISDRSNLTGQVIKGYDLGELIGQGGFGAVYRAWQALVQREVAVKVVLPQFANQPDFVRRFEAEARLVARLESPAIVPLYDYWRDPDGAFLVLRFLRGGSLEAALKKDGAWTPEDADRLLDQITGALAIAHRNGIVHRDLKPANILLDEDRNAYLTDFGIAKNLRNSEDASDKEAGLTGTPAYMTPEQIRQEPVSPQTDIYSLGIVLYELLTGTQPYQGKNSTELLLKQLHEPLPPRELSQNVPEGLYHAIERATQKSPARRYPDVRAMYAAFHHSVAGTVSASGSSASDDLQLIELDMGVAFDPATVVNPYKGLRAFQEADAGDFFGRETLIEQLKSRLAESSPLARFLAVIGPSGSGKSSVVKAGLIPMLRKGADGTLIGSDRWFYLEMVPGAHPMDDLATALLSVAVNPQTDLAVRLRTDERGLLESLGTLLPPNAELVLVIDQFEEVFTQVADEAERAQFLDSLRIAASDPASHLRLIITLRADFYDRPLLYQEFGELIRQRTEVVLPLSAAELERAIVGPAERVGLTVESGLIAAIVADLKAEPGALPLLQYALTEVYERRKGRALTLTAYRESGGALGALARRAEELYAQADEAMQAAARQMFLRLVTLGEGTEDTRRRARWAEIMALAGGTDALQRVLDIYGRYRLLTFDRDPSTREPTIEVAHEALIREWARLRGWLDENREELRLERRLTASTEEWRNARRNPDFLASGARLHQFEELAHSGKLTLSADDLEYIRLSADAREAQAIAAQKHAEEAAQMRRRSQTLVRGLAVGILVAALSIGLAAFALVQSQIAQQERGRALDSAATATFAQGEAIAQAQLANQNAVTATMAQGQAVIQANKAATQAALANNAADTATIAQGQALVQADRANNNAATATNAQGQALVQFNNAATQAQLALNSAATATNAQGLALDQANNAATQAARANNNAATATIAQGQAQIQANNAATQAQLALNNAATATIAQGQAQIQANKAATQAALALDSAATATNAQGQAESARQLADANAQRARQTALSADAQQALTDNNTDLALALALQAVTDVPTTSAPSTLSESVLAQAGYAQGTRRVLSGEHADTVYSVQFSPDGQSAVSASNDRTLVLWNLQTGQPIRRFLGHNAAVTGAAFSPDGKTILSSSLDKTLILWDVSTGQIIRRFTEYNQPIWSVAMSPDGKTALSGMNDGSVVQWNIQTGKAISPFHFHQPGSVVYSVAFSPDGSQGLSGADDQTAQLWQLANGTSILSFNKNTLGAAVNAVAFNPDGKTLAVGLDDGRLETFNAKSGQFMVSFNGHALNVLSAAFSPDGRILVSGSADNTVRLWNVRNGSPIAVLRGHTATVETVAFSPDGATVLSGSDDTTIRQWNVDNGAEVGRLTRGATGGGSALAVSRDGKMALAGFADGTLSLVDTATAKQIRQFKGDTRTINSVTFSVDGQMALSAVQYSPPGGAEQTIRLWDVATGKSLHQFAESGTIYTLAFAPDGKTFASVGYNVMIWDIATGVARTVARANQSGIMYSGAVFSPDGKTLFTGADKDIVVWDVASRKEVRRLVGHTSTVNDLALSPDGSALLSGASDTLAIEWDAVTGRMLRRLIGHTGAVNSVAFSPNGQTAMTGAFDRTARIWDLSTGQELRRFIGHTDTVWGVGFDATGRVMSLSADATLRFWQIQSAQDLMTWIRNNRYVRGLTCDERVRYDLTACSSVALTPTATPTPFYPPLPTFTTTATLLPTKGA
ncbi:MAG: nSTAND1 domain-containing NTPase [Aggregatilineales bacterium]